MHAWGPGPCHSSLSRYLCWSDSGECLFSLQIWNVTQINHTGTVCQCQWFSVETVPLSSGELSWLQCLLRSNCVLCSGKGHCGACPRFPLDFIPCAFAFFFSFSFADYIVYPCSVINIYNFNNFWVPESHSPWSRNAQRCRYHLNTKSGCIAQADSKLILLPLISLMLKFQVGATMQRAVSKEWPLLYCRFNFR